MAHESSTELESLLSPFEEAPNEILYLIFELSCIDNLLQEYPWPSETDPEGPPTKLSLPVIAYLPALSISAVCTRWRSLALASPRLWSQFRLEIAPKRERRSDIQSRFISTLKLYLDRSADSPLLIDLETRGQEEGENPAFDLLLAHTFRWKTFNYTGDYALRNCGDLFLRPSFHILDQLVLRGCDVAIQRSDLDCFRHSPKLRTVRTDCLEASSALPWTQLTSLEARVDREEDITLLSQCPCLTVLKLPNGSVFGPSNTSLASLESFTFVSVNAHDRLKEMFSSFTFPSLKELIIYPEEGSYVNLIWSPDAFSTFISRSSCVLTTLSLGGITISDLDLIAALRLLPSLANFSIHGSLNNPATITTHFISSMHSSSAAHLLPNLRSLSIKFPGISFDDVAFIDMVSSRWISDPATGIACLRSLVLHFRDREVDEQVYEPLWHLDRMGMQVIVSGQYLSSQRKQT